MGANARELAIEPLACLVLVGVDVEHEWGACLIEGGHPFEYLQVLRLEQGCRGDGYRFVTCREKRQAVGDSLADVERFAWGEMAQYREVEHVDAAARGEAEARLALLITEIATLYVLDVAVEVAIGDEERGGIVEASAETPAGGGRGDAADAYPLDDFGLQPALLEEECLRLSDESGTGNETSEEL